MRNCSTSSAPLPAICTSKTPPDGTLRFSQAVEERRTGHTQATGAVTLASVAPCLPCLAGVRKALSIAARWTFAADERRMSPTPHPRTLQARPQYTRH